MAAATRAEASEPPRVSRRCVVQLRATVGPTCFPDVAAFSKSSAPTAVVSAARPPPPRMRAGSAGRV